MNPEKLAELAERAENATGPDRKLDAAIAKALYLPHGRETGWCNSDNGDYYVIDECAKPFTASLDAAMSLVPDKYKDDWLISGNTACLGPDSLYWSEGQADFYANAANPALALVAASLRSLASRGGN